MKSYLPVPVDAARQIALQFEKNIVIICCWDGIHKLLHTTTYGTTPTDKISAAYGGDLCAKALGMDLSQSAVNEDFRTVDAAKNAQLRDVVLRHLPALKDMAAQIISPKDNAFSKLVTDLEAAL